MHRVLLVLLAMLAACDGGNPAPTAASTVPSLPGGSGTRVQGTVVNRFGESVSGASVRVDTGAPVTTGARGEFIVDVVPATYDVAVVVDDPDVPSGFPPVSRAVVYQRLTRRDPVLFVPGLRVQRGSNTKHSTAVQFLSTSGLTGVPLLWAFTNASGFVAAGVVTGAEMHFDWNGSRDAVNPGSLVALIASAQQGITASGHVPMVASDTPLSATVPVTAAPTFTLSAIGRTPPGCSVESFDIVVPASDGTTVAAARFAVAPGLARLETAIVGFTDEVPLSLRVPAICGPGSPTAVAARRLSRTATSLDIDIPPPPVIVTIGDSSSSSAPLVWTAPADSISVVHFDRVESNGFISGTLDLATTSTSTVFPNLDSLHAKVVRGVRLAWHVEAWGGVTGTDALADTSGFGALLAGTGDFSHGVSVPSAVTISP